MSNLEQSKNEMKKDKTTNSTFKDVLALTRKTSDGFSMELLYFSLFTIVSLIIAYLLPVSLIVSVPFVIMPSYFAFTSMRSVKFKTKDIEPSFFKLYGLYFSEMFFGGYRLLVGLLKSLLIYLLISTALFTIFEYSVFLKIPEFKELVDKIGTTQDYMSVLNEYNSFLTNNETVKGYVFLTSSIALTGAAMMFIHHVAKHSVKMKRNFFIPHAAPIRLIYAVDRRVRREHFREIFNIYFKCAWFIQLALLIAGSGGILIGFFFLKNQDISSTSILSIFLMFIVSIPFMNYIAKLQEYIYVKYQRVYEDTFVKMTLEMIDKYRNKLDIEEKDLSEVERILKEHQRENGEQPLENNVEEKKKEAEEDKKL